MLLLAALSCQPKVDTNTPVTTPARPLEFRLDEEVKGLEMRLSHADPPRATLALEAVSEDPATPLTLEQVQELLSRTEPLVEDPGDRREFARRAETKPPPRTGATELLAWPPEPPTVDIPQAQDGPLKVLRMSPEGPVTLAPYLSVTFSKPMVAVTSQDGAAETIPVEIDPLPPGQWRWLGTRTVVFEPDVRFPMATDYTVTVPETGDSTSFSTPPLGLIDWSPSGGPIGLNPVFMLGFDQRIDQDLLEKIVLKGEGETVPLKLATAEQVAADPLLAHRTFQADRTLLLVAERALKPSTSYELIVQKGAPSAEGPKTTTERQSGSFYTYDPLRVDGQDCSTGPKHCAPGGAFWVYFNNPLDDSAFDASMVKVEPEIENLRVQSSWGTLTLTGDTQANTSYTVTLDGSIPDQFGQVLGKAQTRKFKVGTAWPDLQGPGKEMVVLDPGAPPAFSVWTRNHEKLRVRVIKVSPELYPGVSTWMRDARYDGYIKDLPPGELVYEGQISVDDYVPEELVETAIDLSPYLDEGKGHLWIWVEPTTREEYPTRIMAWVQATEIGLTAYADGPGVTGWATSLRDGHPLEGVELSLLGSKSQGTTDSDGLATLPGYDSGAGPHMLVARKGKDLALLPEHTHWWNEWGSWTAQGPQTELRWYTLDDRAMYRPSETVHLKGWVRPFLREPGSALKSWTGTQELSWMAYDAYGNTLGEGSTTIDRHGGWDLALDLPDTPALGWASVHLTTNGGSTSHSFQIQEFRRPEFEVTTHLEPQSFVLGEAAQPSVNAAYYAGGALPNAPVTWNVSATEGSFQPPGWSDWRFGSWTPWWGYRDWGWGGSAGTPTFETLEGSTDAAGNHHLQIDFIAVNPARPMSVTAEATVIDVNRQRWTSSQTMLVHPSRWYVGMKTDKGFYEKGDAVEVQAIVVDVDGQAVAAEATLNLARLEWEILDGRWQEVEKDPKSCEASPTDEPDSCDFTVAVGGQWRVKARVVDPEGRPNETTFTFWVSGQEQKPDRSVSLEELTLVPDGETWKPGDTARLLVISPFSPAEALLTISRDGLMQTRRFHLDQASTTLEIPITEDFVPGVVVQIDVVGSRERTDDEGEPLPDQARRVAFARSTLSLAVPALSRTLTVSATPEQAALSPGATTPISVSVKDADGAPVKDAQVVLIAVDESVLALSGYQLPDPLSIFYMQTGSGVSTYDLRWQVVLADPTTTISSVEEQGLIVDALTRSGYVDADEPMGGAVLASKAMPATPPMEVAADKGEKDNRSKNGRYRSAEGEKKPADPSGPAIAVREDFDALALWAPTVSTGADGTATVQLKLPDSLTRYRIMAVAADDLSFGHGESTVTARQPLMIRPSPPRFLNFGDEVELPLVVQNQTDEPMTVELALEASNILVAAGDRGRRFVVPANDRREVRLPLRADQAGTARFQVVASSGEMADAARFELPVWTPATSEAFATYGQIDDGVILQPVARPDEVWEQFGGLEISTSSTALSELTDALLYLTSYPYDCSEQLASRIIAVAALRDVLEAFEAEQLPSPSELDGAVSRDLERLTKRQKGNGGWSFWADMPDEPYLTVHVTHSLVRAKEGGYPVDEAVLSNAMGYLRDIERHIPHWYGERARRDITAYSVFVRHLHGDEAGPRARKLAKVPLDELSLEAQGWILPTLHAKGDKETVARIIDHWENKVSETSEAAHFVTGVSDTNDYVLLHSSRRVDAILLESLIEVRPEHDLIPKVVRGLLGHRTAGRWSTTQENSFVLLSMNRYFRAYESTTPDFVARAWLGSEYAGEKAFKGYSPDRARIDIPMAKLSDQDLVLQKDGEGRLYYRIGMRYAPLDLDLEPADRGFVVTRAYEAIAASVPMA